MPVYRVFVVYAEEKQLFVRAKNEKEAETIACDLFPYKGGGNYYLDVCDARFEEGDFEEEFLCDND